MPHLENKGTVTITPVPEPANMVAPPDSTAQLIDPESLGSNVNQWPQTVLMDYTDYSREGSYVEKQVQAEKVQGATEGQHMPNNYTLYLPEGFTQYASENSIFVTLESYNNYYFNSMACTGFYLLAFNNTEGLILDHNTAFAQGTGPDPSEYRETTYSGYKAMVYTRESDGKIVYHYDLLFSGEEAAGDKLLVLRFSFVEGFEKSAENMLWVARTIRLYDYYL